MTRNTLWSKTRHWFGLLAAAMVLTATVSVAQADGGDGGADAAEEFQQNLQQQTVAKTQIQLAKLLYIDNELALPIFRATATFMVAELQQKLDALVQREREMMNQAAAANLRRWMLGDPTGFRVAMMTAMNLMLFGIIPRVPVPRASDILMAHTLYTFCALAILNYQREQYRLWWNANKVVALRSMGVTPEISPTGDVAPAALSLADMATGLRAKRYQNIVVLNQKDAVILKSAVISMAALNSLIPSLKSMPQMRANLPAGQIWEIGNNLVISVAPGPGAPMSTTGDAK